MIENITTSPRCLVINSLLILLKFIVFSSTLTQVLFYYFTPYYSVQIYYRAEHSPLVTESTHDDSVSNQQQQIYWRLKFVDSVVHQTFIQTHCVFFFISIITACAYASPQRTLII